LVRPAIVLAIPGRAETTHFDMGQAFDTLARFPVLPRGGGRPNVTLTNVPANYGDVGAAIVKFIKMEKPNYSIYIYFWDRRAAYKELIHDTWPKLRLVPSPFQPWLAGPFSKTVNWLAFKAPCWLMDVLAESVLGRT